MSTFLRVLWTSLLVSALPGCGGDPRRNPAAPHPTSAPPVASLDVPTTSGSFAQTPPTVADAEQFYASVDGELRRLWAARDRASWVNQTYLTEDSDALAASGEEASAEYASRIIPESSRFSEAHLTPELKRKAELLRRMQTVPAPRDAGRRAELSAIEASMGSYYGKAKACPPRASAKCRRLSDLEKVLSKSRDPKELLEAWVGWHELFSPMRKPFARYVELANEGSREIGFRDMGELWKSGYDMPPESFEADIERLWARVQPLYAQLHCYVRAKLRVLYGEHAISKSGAIPAHLLGNMWAQDWSSIDDIVRPYPKQPVLDVDKALAAKKVDARAMVKIGERFFVSLGFDPLPPSFWDRSQFERPRDREVVCHASAWDVGWNDDLRIKMCIEPTLTDLLTIHHELGHDYYFHEYHRQPMLFQAGANDGFHEGIGDTLSLSVTPGYLKSIGLLQAVPDGLEGLINQQLRMALERVAFLPFGLLVDKWRWDVFSGKIPDSQLTDSWWKMRRNYQGVEPPVARSETDFDPAAKYHVSSSTPYIRYFLARIYQFQFHRALCKAAGQKGALASCSIFGSKPAGDKLRRMLALGASKPWPEALRELSGEPQADPSALLEYFAPLDQWLREANKTEACGY